MLSRKLRECGVGAGGAGFPTGVKAAFSTIANLHDAIFTAIASTSKVEALGVVESFSVASLI